MYRENGRSCIMHLQVIHFFQCFYEFYLFSLALLLPKFLHGESFHFSFQQSVLSTMIISCFRARFCTLSRLQKKKTQRSRNNVCVSKSRAGARLQACNGRVGAEGNARVPHQPHCEPWKSHDALGERRKTGLLKAPPLALEPVGWWELIKLFFKLFSQYNIHHGLLTVPICVTEVCSIWPFL